MDYLSEIITTKGMCKYNLKEYKLFSNVFVPLNYDSNSINWKQLKDIRKDCESYMDKRKAIWSSDISDSKEKEYRMKEFEMNWYINFPY